MRDQYNVSGQAGAVGPGAHADNMSFVQASFVNGLPDPAALASDLALLRSHLRANASEREHDLALAILADAERAAEDGDVEGAVQRLSALRRLRAAGPWALGAATSIGAGVAAAAIKGVLGI